MAKLWPYFKILLAELAVIFKAVGRILCLIVGNTVRHTDRRAAFVRQFTYGKIIYKVFTQFVKENHHKFCRHFSSKMQTYLFEIPSKEMIKVSCLCFKMLYSNLFQLMSSTISQSGIFEFSDQFLRRIIVIDVGSVVRHVRQGLVIFWK